MWWMIAAAGAKIGLAVLGGEAARNTASANSRISTANATAGNKTRQLSNTASAARTNLQRWQQSLNNQRVLDAGGDQLEANTQNYLRSVDAQSYDDINRSLTDAEQLGAQAVAGGNVGAIGGVADMVDTSTRIRSGIVGQMMKSTSDLARHDSAKRAGIIFSQTVQSLDNSLILDAFDWQKDIGQESTAPSRWASAFPAVVESAGNLLSSLGTSGPTAGPPSTYSISTASNAKFGFKGPPISTLPSSDNNWSLGSGKLFSVGEAPRAVNPYSLWGSNG